MTIFNSERVENVCNFFYLYNYAKENVRKAKNPIQGVKKNGGKILLRKSMLVKIFKNWQFCNGTKMCLKPPTETFRPVLGIVQGWDFICKLSKTNWTTNHHQIKDSKMDFIKENNKDNFKDELNKPN